MSNKKAAMPTINTSLEGKKLNKSMKYLSDYIFELKELMIQLPIAIDAEKVAFRKTELRIKLLKTEVELESLGNILINRVNHYDNVFLPRHRKQIEECEAHFDKYFELAKEYASKKENSASIITKAFNAYMLENPERTDTELNLALYQGMKQMFDKMPKKR